MKDARTKALKALEGYHDTSESEIDDETRLGDDLMLDSLDKVAIIMDIEEDYGTEISDAQAEEIQTFGDLRKLFQGLGA